MSQSPYQQPPFNPQAGYGWPYPTPAPFPPPSATDPGLNQPWYGIGFLPALIRPYKKYADFSGRASRGEYWWYQLGWILLYFAWGIILTMVESATGAGDSGDPLNGFGWFWIVLYGLLLLGSIIPSIALTVRRLHDGNMSGLWMLIGLVPLAGTIWLIVLLASPTHPGPTIYDNPLAGDAAYGPDAVYPPSAGIMPYQPYGYPYQPPMPGGYPVQPYADPYQAPMPGGYPAQPAYPPYQAPPHTPQQ